MIRRLAVLLLLARACAPAFAGTDDPRLERVRAYRALDAEALKSVASRVRVADLLAIVSDPTAPKDIREEAAAAIFSDLALVNDPDLSLAGRGTQRPRLILLTKVLGLLHHDDALTQSLAKTICEGLFPSWRLAGESLRPEALRALVAKRRAEALADLAGQRLEEIVRRRIQARVAPRGAGFNDIQAWMRKEAVEAFTELAGQLQTWDSSITVADAKALFAARPLRTDGWRSASYGTGSFLLDPAPPPAAPAPKPPTRDTWWGAASISDRLGFWWATFVERSGLYEVRREWEPCSACAGTGRQSRRLAGGVVEEWLCARCGGRRLELTVRYR